MKKTTSFLKKSLWYLVRPKKTFENLKYYLIDHGTKPLAYDRRMNQIVSQTAPHILFIRHTYSVAGYNHHFILWVQKNYPSLARHIRLARVTRLPIGLKNTALVVPWLQDPLKERYPGVYRRMTRLQNACRERDIPVINPVERLSVSIKSRALPRIQNCGIRTAKIIRVSDRADFHPQKHNLPYPFFIREDCLHGGSECMINGEADLKNINWDAFIDPIAMEYINVQNKDGLYRKYRYILVGDTGTQKHLIVSKNWRVHFKDRIDPDLAKNEELRYLNLPSDPNHEVLNQARQALELDTVAFDYSYDQSGHLVVWEPNPFPLLWSKDYLDPSLSYYEPHFDRLYKNLLIYYFKKAGLDGRLKAEDLT